MPKFQLKLRSKILLLAVPSALLSTMAILWRLAYQEKEAEIAVQEGIDTLGSELVEQSVNGLYNSVSVAERMLVMQQKRSIEVIMDYFRTAGGITLGKNDVTVSAI